MGIDFIIFIFVVEIFVYVVIRGVEFVYRFCWLNDFVYLGKFLFLCLE